MLCFDGPTHPHLHDRNNPLDVVEGKNRAEIHSLKRWFVENADIIKTKIQ